MSKVSDLTSMARELRRIQKDRKQYAALQDKVVDNFFKRMDAAAPPDKTGRLRASLQRRPFDGQSEWVVERNGYTIRAGTKVFYAVMVNDGHVIGKRKRGVSHKKRRRAVNYDNYTNVKGWVPGKFFTEKALKGLEEDVQREVLTFFDGLLGQVAD